MTTLPQQKLDALLARHALVESELATGLAADAYVRLSREFAELSPVVDVIKAYRAANKEIADLDALANDNGGDAEMRRLAQTEKQAVEERRDRLAQQLRIALIPKDAMDDHNAILEIRAGTGGDEAALFAGDLFRMYERYAATQGWKIEILSISEGTKGGFKEIIAEVRGRGVFAKLKFESGVHRVQRVPSTEAQGRIHTSTATVAAEVWMRPEASVSGTRCTRCTPDSNLSLAKAPRPRTSAMTSLKPPLVPSLTEMISTFQPCLVA